MVSTLIYSWFPEIESHFSAFFKYFSQPSFAAIRLKPVSSVRECSRVVCDILTTYGRAFEKFSSDSDRRFSGHLTDTRWRSPRLTISRRGRTKRKFRNDANPVFYHAGGFQKSKVIFCGVKTKTPRIVENRRVNDPEFLSVQFPTAIERRALPHNTDYRVRGDVVCVWVCVYSDILCVRAQTGIV